MGNYSDTKIKYAKILLGGQAGGVGGENLMAYEGFVRFELGDPANGVTSVSGAKGSYEVVDDVEAYVYRNSSITCLEGSPCQILLAEYFDSNNYGSGVGLTLIKNNNLSGNMMSDSTSFKIRCVKNPGVRSGMGVTDNDAGAARVTYYLELQHVSEIITQKSY